MRTRLLVARNVAKAWLLLGGVAALLTALGWWLGGLRLAGLFFVTALLMVATLYWYGPRVVLASLGARELLIAEAPAVYSSVERLALAAEVPRPRLYVIETGHPHAFAVGRGASAAGIAVTRGLLSLLPPAEFDGVLAHELAHVRHRDVVVQTPVVVVAGWILEASRIGGFLVYRVLLQLVIATFGKTSISDMRRMEALLRDSDLRWTIMRPSKLFDAPGVSSYELHEGQAPGIFTSRADLAASLLKQASDDRFVRKAVEVTTSQGVPTLLQLFRR